MQRFLVLLFTVLSLSSADVYQVDDVVSDLTFQEANLVNGKVESYRQSIYSLIAQKKVILINFFQTG